MLNRECSRLHGPKASQRLRPEAAALPRAVGNASDAEHTKCMPTSTLPATADEQLIRAAMLRAGAQIHSIVGIVAMYRSAVGDSPKTARPLERKLRQSVASGNLTR